jgi:hypothetical protein
MQTDCGGEYEKLIPFLIKLAYLTLSLVLILISRMEPRRENIDTLLKSGCPYLHRLICLSNIGAKPSLLPHS